MKRSILIAMAITLATTIPAFSQSTSARGEFSLQGRLSTTSGSAVADGQHTLTVRVYERGSSTAVYTETETVTTVDGIFSTMIGDNGSGELRFNATSEYELGITVDAEAELMPRLRIGEAPRATTADVALDAQAVAGFRVSTDGSAQPNTLVTLNQQGEINASLLANSTVTGINGMRGDVTIEGGGGLAVNRTGNTIALSFTGSGSGLNLPFSDSSAFGAGQTGLSITSTGAGSAATFVNAAAGTALSVQGTTGAAISATTNATGSAAITANNTAGAAISATANSTTSAAIDVRNTAGAAINATGSAATDAVVRIQNTSSGASARLINALDASGTAAFSVAASGQTTIRSTVGNALDVSTSAAGEAALKVTGGLSLNGPVGTATIAAGQASVVVNNVYAKANSVILLTVNGAVDAVPLRIVSQGAGTFTVGLASSLVGTLTGGVSFNYLIVNQ
jgi:hypothetical protein